MSELLPCPFCGGEAKVCRGIYGSWFVRCANDYKNMANHGCYVSPTTTAKDTEAEAIAAWNTRAVETCRNISPKLGNNEFTCEECCARVYGAKGQWFDANWNYHDFKYCPNCGARVVGE